MIIKVKVYPSSGKEEIIKLTEDSYKVYLKKPSVDNKANIKLIKMLKKYFDCQYIKVIKGLKTHEKLIEYGI